MKWTQGQWVSIILITISLYQSEFEANHTNKWHLLFVGPFIFNESNGGWIKYEFRFTKSMTFISDEAQRKSMRL